LRVPGDSRVTIGVELAEFLSGHQPSRLLSVVPKDWKIKTQRSRRLGKCQQGYISEPKCLRDVKNKKKGSDRRRKKVSGYL